MLTLWYSALMCANRLTFYWQRKTVFIDGAVLPGQEKYALAVGVYVAIKKTMIHNLVMIIKAAAVIR